GAAWSDVTAMTPSPILSAAGFWGTSASDMWTTTVVTPQASADGFSLGMWHWDGCAWANRGTTVTNVGDAIVDYYPRGLAGSGDDDVWASFGGSMTHWDGMTW